MEREWKKREEELKGSGEEMEREDVLTGGR